MTITLENTTSALPDEAKLEVVKPYEAPTIVELDVAGTEAGGPGATDAGFLS